MGDGKTPKNEYEAALVVIERLEKEKAQLVKALERQRARFQVVTGLVDGVNLVSFSTGLVEGRSLSQDFVQICETLTAAKGGGE
jgi:transcriptional regulator GlxA family with amidase domain